MPSTVRVPTPLRPLVQGRDIVTVGGSTGREVLDDLERQCPGIRQRICEESGEVRRFVNVFLNDEDIVHINGLDSLVSDGDVLSIVPAIAGGGSGRPNPSRPPQTKGN